MGNFIIVNGNNWPEDNNLFFGDEEIIFLNSGTMLDILVQFGTFSSKNEAKKNWKGPIEIPDGFSQFTVGKLKKTISILKPTYTSRD